MALINPTGTGDTQADGALTSFTRGYSRRSPEDITDDFLKNIGRRKVVVPATLKPLLEQTFASRRAFRDRLIQWSHDHASDTGVGFFGIKLDAWRLSAKSKGHQGYLRCSVPGCDWHVKIEETQVGSSEAVAAYDAQLAHTQGVPHLPVEAPKVEVATAPGFKVFPPEYKDLALLLHRSGCPPSAILKLLNTKAREEGVTQSWDYRSVYALVAKAGVAREDDASNLLEWLQERLTSSGLGYSLHLDAGGHLERVFFEMRGVMTWKARAKPVNAFFYDPLNPEQPLVDGQQSSWAYPR